MTDWRIDLKMQLKLKRKHSTICQNLVEEQYDTYPFVVRETGVLQQVKTASNNRENMAALCIPTKDVLWHIGGSV